MSTINNTNAEKAYSAEVIFQLHDLSKIQKVAIITNSAKKLEELVPEPGNGDFLLEGIANYARVAIHNEKARENKDYERLVIFTDDGGAFYTGSPTFSDRFTQIMELMEGESGWALSCEKGKSNNYKGKTFLTCKVVGL